MEVKFAEACVIQAGRTHALWNVKCRFISGGRQTAWEFLLAIKRPCETTCKAWASENDDVEQFFAKMAALGYEAVIINRRRLERSARAAGIDINREELTVTFPGARSQASTAWARSAIAP
eukprot:329758-Rhodomonas_salina.1